MNYSSVISSIGNNKPEQTNSGIWQEIISTDAKFNLYRINNNSQLSNICLIGTTETFQS